MENETKQGQACDLDFEEMESVAGGTDSEVVTCSCCGATTSRYVAHDGRLWCSDCFTINVMKLNPYLD